MLKHITISELNYEKLRNLGKTGESFNDVLSRLLKNISIRGGDNNGPV